MSQTQGAAIDPAVAEELAAYDKGRTIAALRAAADAAALHDGETPADPAAAQAMARTRLADWIAILSRFKRDLDPDFNPDDPPATSIVPPGEFGNQYAPGVNPKDVKDPEMRRQYLIAIEQNRDKLRRFGANVKLAEAHTTIRDRAAASIRDARETLGLDAAEITAALAAGDITQSDREALLAGP